MGVHDGPVLITGASGLLGYWLLQTAPPDVDIVGVTHRRSITRAASVQADLRDADSTRSAFAAARPALVVHAAYAKDRQSIVEATDNVVRGADSVGAPVMFISTDAVFAGHGTIRDEQSTPDPISDYGRWKALAEQIVVGESERNSVIRLPLLVSVDPDDPAVDKIRTSAAASLTTQWYSDEMRRPALTSEIAEALWRITDLSDSERAGFWHLSGARQMSRFELASWVVETLDLPRSSIESALQPGDAPRPRNLNLSAQRAESVVAWYPNELR